MIVRNLIKRNQKQKLIAENSALSDKIDSILKEIGIENMYQFIKDDIDENLDHLDGEIEDEQAFAKENPPGSTYGSAGTEARKRVKYLRGLKKKHQEVDKMFQRFLKMKKKVDSL